MHDGATRDDVLVGSVDLSACAPGPMTLAITPDRKTVLVSISAGWLDNFVTVPAGGEDKVLFVDLASRMVTGELVTGSGPMGIVVMPDGKQAYVGQYCETYFALVEYREKNVEMKLDGDVATAVQTVPVADAESGAYGSTVDPDGRVLAAVPKEHYISVTDLEAGTSFIVPWNVTENGPTDIRCVR